MTSLVFLFDVDNTLLDNDRAKADQQAQIERLAGPELGARFWECYEAARRERGYVDYLRTLELFREAFPEVPSFPHVAALLLGFPYQDYVFGGAFEAIAHVQRLGTPVVVSDGDPVFQAAKIARSGLAHAVDERVLITVHKEAVLDHILRWAPGDRYVLIDDKPGILAAVKARLGERVVTVHVDQGHYARDDAGLAPRADKRLPSIRELTALTLASLP